MNEQIIICPNCKTEIPFTKAIENKIRNDLEKKLKDEIKEKENNLIKENSIINEENKILREQINKKVEIDNKKLIELSNIEREAGKYEASKELNSKHDYEIQKLKEDHKNERKEDRLIFEKLTKQIEELAKQADKTPTDIKGEVGENNIKDLIKILYPNDNVEIIPKKYGGADVIHTITEQNHKCGSILYECKNTDTFNKEWIDKVKKDSLEIKSDYNIIVTKTMPKDNNKTHNINNVWISNFYEIESVIKLLRDNIIKLDIAYNSNSNGSYKREELYKYVTSIEYNRKTEIILGKLNERRSKQEKKKKEFETYWKKEIEETSNLILELNDIFYSIDEIKNENLDKSELIIIENKR